MQKELKETNRHFVEKRLLNLKTLKDRYDLSSKARDWKHKANLKEVTPILEDNDFRTQVSAIVKRQKDAELSANMPEYSFIPLSEEGERNRKIIKEAWKYHWLKSNTDKAIDKIISQATTYGTGILFEGIEHLIKTVKEPYTKDIEVDGQKFKTIDFKDRTIQSSHIKSEKIPFANFFINGTDIEESTEAVIVRYFEKDIYIKEKKLNPQFKNIDQVKDSVKEYALISKIDGEDKTTSENDYNTITEIEYWNCATDEYIVLANGIEILNSHIPYSHKELPFCIYIDNEAEDRFWGIGEFELLEQDEKAKNEYRTLTVKSVKASIGFLLKDRNSDLEVSDIEYGVQEVLETDDLDGITHFAPNVPVSAISELEQRVDNDIINKSGIDFKSQELSPNETATRTANKTLSGKKRINKNIKTNGFGFFRRLGKLRLSNIQQLHSVTAKRIPIEGGSIDNSGVFISDETGGYGSAIIGEEFTKGDFLVVPITESLLGESDQKSKDNLSIFMQTTGNLTGEDGRPIIKPAQLAKLACDQYGFDYEKLTEEVVDSQSAQSIVDKVFGGQQQSPDNPNNPNYVPPEQRSQQQQVATISGQASPINSNQNIGL